jgi:predicted GIY-YIG superfamily endonuclease
MFYAYILESMEKPGELYRGHTDDLKRRVAEHNARKCPHTSKYKPWKVKFYAAFETFDLAQEFERYLKSGSGHAFANKHFFMLTRALFDSYVAVPDGARSSLC